MLFGLECWAGKSKLVLPIEAVRQIIEYELSPPPPMARRFVGGFAMHDGRLVVSLALAPAVFAPPGTRMKGILLQGALNGIEFALAVTQVGGFVTCTPVDEPRDPKRPRWLTKVATADKRTAVFLDVPMFLALLARNDDADASGLSGAG
jgi:hypothetical protein